MHSDIRVVKEALKQLRKADSWVSPALDLEDIDSELAQRWADTLNSVENELKDYLDGVMS